MSEFQAMNIKIVALAGGVGGAKLVDGLMSILSPSELTVIVNTGDDFEHLGLQISPDLDTVCYTMAGLANPSTGWGRSNETWQALQNVKKLGGPTWFQIGDQDLGVHLERTRRLKGGEKLSAITRDFCASWEIRHAVIPMSDNPVRTFVDTKEYGSIPFQEYFVFHQCKPQVQGFYFEGAQSAHPAPGVLEAIENSDCVVICPSNPWVSIDPILSIPGIHDCIMKKKIVAVSPIIGEQTIKGPAAKMYREMGIQPSAFAVANHYYVKKILSGFILHTSDIELIQKINPWGIISFGTNILMTSREERSRLAHDVIQFITDNILDR